MLNRLDAAIAKVINGEEPEKLLTLLIDTRASYNTILENNSRLKKENNELKLKVEQLMYAIIEISETVENIRKELIK